MRKMQLERGAIAIFDAERLEQMVARDGRQIQSMIRLIDDMLDVSRAHRGRLPIRPGKMDLTALLERVVDDLEPQASAQGCPLALRAQARVFGFWDEFRIEQVVVNLLNNALRYGRKKPIEVTLASHAEQAVITVRDYGVGISGHDQQRIFEAFERGLDNQVPGGLGLGLYIAKQLIEAHRGEIKVSSRLGEGALFSVSLPLAPIPGQ